MDFPAPFGPMSAIRSPASIAEGDLAEDDALAVGDGDPIELDDRPAHTSYPVRARRRMSRKNGAPMIAVTTPTGIPPATRAMMSA